MPELSVNKSENLKIMKKSLLLLAVILFTLCNNTFAAPLKQGDGKYLITTTQQLNDPVYAQKIEDFYATGEEGTFTGKNDVPIYYKIFRQPGKEKGAILISSGRTEGALKYKEVIYDLFNNGYSVYIHDHRGQGLSGRMAKDPEMGYVDNFQYYIDDMKYFYDTYLKPDKHQKIFLLSHSLGGAIAMSYLEQYPGDFDAASFSSPMLGLASYICPLAHILYTKTPKYAPGQTGYHRDSSSFATNSVTGSEVRFHRATEAYRLQPEARLGGATVQWLKESCDHMKAVSKNISKIETPFILFAAENETVVNHKTETKFVAKAQKLGKDCNIFPIGDAQHELLMEKDPQRTDVMTKTLDFFGKY